MRFIFAAAFFSIITLTSMTGIASADEISAAKRDNIVKLMEITGSKNVGMQMGRAMIQNLTSVLKANNPEMPEQAFVILAEETNQMVEEHIDELLATIIPIYDKYFTEKEIQELLDFYQTPVGEKTISVLPQLTQDSMLAGQSWGQAMIPALVDNLEARFKEEGIEINQ